MHVLGGIAASFEQPCQQGSWSADQMWHGLSSALLVLLWVCFYVGLADGASCTGTGYPEFRVPLRSRVEAAQTPRAAGGVGGRAAAPAPASSKLPPDDLQSASEPACHHIRGVPPWAEWANVHNSNCLHSLPLPGLHAGPGRRRLRQVVVTSLPAAPVQPNGTSIGLSALGVCTVWHASW